MSMSLSDSTVAHFVGIKGVAMTSLAIIAQEMGIQVTGSDTTEVFPTDAILKRFGITYMHGFSPKHIPHNCDVLVYTGAHEGQQNREVIAAKKKGIATLPHARALADVMREKKTISIAGSHGKTTTSALISSMFTTAGTNPSYATGCAEILHLGRPAKFGTGEWFIAEADEYVTDPTSDQTPRFLWQYPEILTVTNIDFDHPDVYKSLGDVIMAFKRFAQNVNNSGAIILNYDDDSSMNIASTVKRKLYTFGQHQKADFHISKITFTKYTTFFNLRFRNDWNHTFGLNIPGEHNVYNASAAIATSFLAKIPLKAITKALGAFRGTKRRFELIREINGKQLFDDYAHHPAEIRATLKAAKNRYPHNRIIVIFQPHTYSRTESLLQDFGKAFSFADKIVLMPIYASAREKTRNSSLDLRLIESIRSNKPEAVRMASKSHMLQYIKSFSKPGDLIITMGAGSIFSWLEEILEIL